MLPTGLAQAGFCRAFGLAEEDDMTQSGREVK